MKSQNSVSETKRRKSTKASGLKKAPQAPKRFKSPYILFSISKMQKYKVLYKNAKVTSFSSLISKEWKALTEEEKKKWKMFAEQDKLRYNTEKRFYKGPWQVPSERLRKDPLAPKRPPSAFLNYSRTRRAALIEENPHVKNTDISKLLGKEWRAAPQEVRQPYIDTEVREREAYHKKIMEWRKQQLKAKETVDTTQFKPSPIQNEQTSPQALHPPPSIKATPSLVLSSPISTLLLEATTPTGRLETENLEWSSYSSPKGPMPIPNSAKSTNNNSSVANPRTFSSLTPLEKNGLKPERDLELSMGCESHACAPQKPSYSSSPYGYSSPTTRSEPVPISIRLPTTNRLNSNPYTFNLVEAAPVTPLQPPRSVSTIEYQNLFFPTTYEERYSAANNVVKSEDLDLLFDSASEGMDQSAKEWIDEWASPEVATRRAVRFWPNS